MLHDNLFRIKIKEKINFSLIYIHAAVFLIVTTLVNVIGIFSYIGRYVKKLKRFDEFL